MAKKKNAFDDAFESIEVFLRSVGAKFLYYNRNSAPLKNKHEFHEHRARIKHNKPQIGTPEYYRAYVKCLNRSNCNKLMSELSSRVPEISKVAHSYRWNQGDAFLLWGCCEICRHTIVHCRETSD